MVYVALLRGINVGGNNKVEMRRLKKLFEGLGYTQVVTYINSGNVIFESSESDTNKLSATIEQAIETEFGFPVKVVVVKREALEYIVSQVPSNWVTDSTNMRCDVLFLWPDIDGPEVIQMIKQTPEIDELVYFPGAIVWKFLRKDVNKSSMHKLIGTEVYKKSTARNINTVRKLCDMMQAAVKPNI